MERVCSVIDVQAAARLLIDDREAGIDGDEATSKMSKLSSQKGWREHSSAAIWLDRSRDSVSHVYSVG